VRVLGGVARAVCEDCNNATCFQIVTPGRSAGGGGCDVLSHGAGKLRLAGRDGSIEA